MKRWKKKNSAAVDTPATNGGCGIVPLQPRITGVGLPLSSICCILVTLNKISPSYSVGFIALLHASCMVMRVVDTTAIAAVVPFDVIVVADWSRLILFPLVFFSFFAPL